MFSVSSSTGANGVLVPSSAGAPMPLAPRLLVRCPLEGVPEWALLELQGELTCRQAGSTALTAEGFAGKTLGELSLSPAGKPHLVIGNRSLDGTVCVLKKPLVVAKTVQAGATSSGGGKGGNSGVSKPKQIQLVVVAVIRKKFMFTRAPNPIVKKRVLAQQAAARAEIEAAKVRGLEDCLLGSGTAVASSLDNVDDSPVGAPTVGVKRAAATDTAKSPSKYRKL